MLSASNTRLVLSLLLFCPFCCLENGRIMYGWVKIWSCIVFTNLQHKLYSFFKSQPGNFTLDIIVKYIIIKRSLEWLGFRISDYWLGHKKAFNLLFVFLNFLFVSFLFRIFYLFLLSFLYFHRQVSLLSLLPYRWVSLQEKVGSRVSSAMNSMLISQSYISFSAYVETDRLPWTFCIP